MSEHDEVLNEIERLRDTRWIEKHVTALGGFTKEQRIELRRAFKARPAEDFDGHLRASEIGSALFGRLTCDQLVELCGTLFPRLAPHFARLLRSSAPWAATRSMVYPVFPFRFAGDCDDAAAWVSAIAWEQCELLRGLDPEPAWMAAHAPHFLDPYDEETRSGWLLGAVLRGGGTDAEATRRVLIESIRGEHEVGRIGPHAIQALLLSDEREDWEVIGELLLGAQRQEGLRQSILESAHLGSVGGFRHVLGVILEHDLGRFSATVRAFDLWLGTRWAGGSARVIHEGLSRVREFLDDEGAALRALASGSGEEAYFALWTLGFCDAERGVAAAAPMLSDEDPERRFAALRILQGSRVRSAGAAVLDRVVSGDEDDPRVRMALSRCVGLWDFTKAVPQLFDAVREMFESAPARAKRLQPILWPWEVEKHDRRVVGVALRKVAAGEPERLLPFAGGLGGDDCCALIKQLAGMPDWFDTEKRKRKRLTGEARAAVLALTADARKDVHTAALEALDFGNVGPDEVAQYVSILHRKAATLRKGAISRLCKLPADRALQAADELLGMENEKQRAAGLEIAAHFLQEERGAVRALLERRREALGESELGALADGLLGGRVREASLEDCFGLVPGGSTTPLVEVRRHGEKLDTSGAVVCLKDLAALFTRHAETEIEVRRGSVSEEGSSKVLLGNAGWAFPRPERGVEVAADAEARLPLREVWVSWLEGRERRLRDPDGLELLRVYLIVEDYGLWERYAPRRLRRSRSWEVKAALEHLMMWMLKLSPTSGGGAMLARYAEDGLVSDLERLERTKHESQDSRFGDRSSTALRLVSDGIVSVEPADRRRLVQLGFAATGRGLNGWRVRPGLEEFLAAYDDGFFNTFDFVWLLLRAVESRQEWMARYSFGPIREASTFRAQSVFVDRGPLIEAVGRVRTRLVELELSRGEQATPASFAAAELTYSGGATTLFALLKALGRDKILRQHEWGEPTRKGSLSRLISVTRPESGDTPEAFCEHLAASSVTPARMLEVAMFAPQWAGHIEAATEFPGLEEAVWWVHAHTKTRDYWRASELREVWQAQIAERTHLEAEDLEEGAVDVAWFGRVITLVGEDGWRKLMKPAR